MCLGSRYWNGVERYRALTWLRDYDHATTFAQTFQIYFLCLTASPWINEPFRHLPAVPNTVPSHSSFNRISESSTQSHHPSSSRCIGYTHTHCRCKEWIDLALQPNHKILGRLRYRVADSPNLFGLTPVLVIPQHSTSCCRWKEETEAATLNKKYSSDFFRGHH